MNNTMKVFAQVHSITVPIVDKSPLMNDHDFAIIFGHTNTCKHLNKNFKSLRKKGEKKFRRHLNIMTLPEQVGFCDVNGSGIH